jgi:threonine dehydrogenase-like Zn-dependent dehydrogenase
VTALGVDDVEVEIEAEAPACGSAAGRVVATGERAIVLAGKRVLVGPLEPCGECEVCRRGGAPVCPLAKRRRDLGERRLVAAGRWTVALGDGIELALPAAAAVAGDVAIAYTMYARTGIGPREPAVITGASAVARFVVEILVAKGVTPAVVADPAAAAWCDWLLAKGAIVSRVSAAAGDDEARHIVATALRAAAADPGASAPETAGKPWRVFACGDHARAHALAGARATLTALAPSPPLPAELVAREVTIIGVAGAHPDLVVEAAAMCVKREIDLAGGVTADRGDPTRTYVR